MDPVVNDEPGDKGIDDSLTFVFWSSVTWGLARELTACPGEFLLPEEDSRAALIESLSGSFQTKLIVKFQYLCTH